MATASALESSGWPKRICAGLAAAYMRAALTILSVGTQVSCESSSSEYLATSAFSLSKPKVHFSTNSLSYRFSSMMTLIMARARAPSAPGRMRSQSSARDASQPLYGSTTMSLAPRFIMSMT